MLNISCLELETIGRICEDAGVPYKITGAG